MNRRCLIAAGLFAGSLVVSTSLHAQDARQQARQRLIEQIHNGETLYRDDLVDDAIQRLYRIDPGAPEGLVAQIGLAVKRNQADQARVLLNQLQKQAPDSALLRQAEALIRVAGPDAQSALTQARLFASVGRVAEARSAYDRVFQGVYPTADLALEYWLLRSREPDSRSVAIDQLERLLATYPRHPGLLLALANFAFSTDRPAQALAYLRTLASIAGQRETAAAREYDYLNTLPPSAASVAAWRSFNERYAGLPVQVRANERLMAQNALVSDPVWQAGRRALENVEQGGRQENLAALRAAVKAYPDDAGFLGALGLAYLRLNNRSQALQYFERAKEKEPRIDQASRWVSLIQSTQDWLTLQRADQLALAQRWDQARALYAQVARNDPLNIFALIGLGDAALAQNQAERAWAWHRKAFALEPDNESAQNAVGRYLATQPAEQALTLLETFPANQKKYLATVRRALQVARLQDQATQAEQAGHTGQAIDLLTQAQALDSADPWLSFRLASLLLQTGQRDQALAAYDRHLAQHADEPASRYAQALLLESADAWNQALAALGAIDPAAWTDDMVALADRVRTRERIAQAAELFDQGQPLAAIAALEHPPENTQTRLQVAEWSGLIGDYARALANYRAVLRQEPDNLEARLGELETWLAQGKTESVRAALSNAPPIPPDTNTNAQRRLAGLWNSLGDTAQARTLLALAAQRTTGPDPLLFRDFARTVAPENPQQALDLYQKAMVDADLLAPAQATTPRDNEAFTQAMQIQPGDDWLRRSIRTDAGTLYQRENTTLHLSNDGWVRTDGTPGLSRLNAGTTLLQINHPLQNGVAFIRADHIRLDAGTFETTANGEIDERFGTCIFPGLDAQGTTQSLPGCTTGLRQKVQGTSFALGWQGDRFGFDIGRTPQSFPVSNWVGGVNLQGDLGQAGWSLDLSRRPMSNSLLSLAGATDPRTGIVWGGALATGATLGLSWDQGEAHGVWASLGHHRITGTNMAANQRTRIMGGYYHRLINEPDRLLTVGVNAMHWRYQRDLGGYTLGQGGYYSPQRYSSVSLPVSYAQRTENWSFAVRGSVSRSVASSRDEPFYPLNNLIAGPVAALQQRGVTAAGLQAANTSTGTTSGDWGYTLSGMVERRLNGHWVVGAGFDLQRGQDYTPSRFMLYLRYTLQPWRGSLPLGPIPLTPYADFN